MLITVIAYIYYYVAGPVLKHFANIDHLNP